MRCFLVLIFILLISYSTSKERAYKFEIKIAISQLNLFLESVFSEENSLYKIQMNLLPETNEIEVFGKAKISFERFLDITSTSSWKDSLDFYPEGIPFYFKLGLNILREGSLRIAFRDIRIFGGSDEIKFNSFSIAANIFGNMLIDTQLGSLIQDKANEIKPISAGSGKSPLEIDLSKFNIQKDIKFIGESILIKLVPSKILSGSFLNSHNMLDPRLWYFGVFYDYYEEESYFLITIGEGTPKESYTQRMNEHLKKTQSILKGGN